MWPISLSSSSDSPLSKTIAPTSSGSITHVAPESLSSPLERLIQGICRIVRPDGRGTASLIGPCLLLTTHRLLPDKETARSSYAMFIHQTGKPLDKSTINIISLPLDPDRYFQTSPELIVSVGNRMITQPVQEGRLDFTIVAIKEDPYLFSLQSAVWSLFERSSFKRGDPVSVIYVPHTIDVTTMSKGGIAVSRGEIKDYDENSLFHNCAMTTDFEGGIVVDQEGQPIALHQYKVSECLHSAVLISNIAKELESKPLGVETLNAICLSTQDKIIELPETTALFTGREEELRLLEKACLGGGKRVAIVGLGGIGKTALAVKYANDHRGDYSLICFIESETKSQIENRLLNLAAELNIEKQNREYTLLALR